MSGTALIEFAFTVPVLLLLFIGGVTVTELIAVNRKVTVATRSLTDLVSRNMSPAIIYNNPQFASGRAYLSASAVSLSPYKLDLATQQISLLRVCDSSRAYVVWTQAQTQNADGTIITATTPSDTSGTLPNIEPQSDDNVVTISSDMVTASMVPSSPDGTNVCDNLEPGDSDTTQVGTAGAWLFRGKITYNYTPAISFLPITTTQISDTIYMSPRLF